MQQTKVAGSKQKEETYSYEEVETALAADPVIAYMSKEQLEKSIKNLKAEMQNAAKDLDFVQAARYRDEMYILTKKLKSLE